MIARDWNVPASGVGYVTRFRVRSHFLDRYDVHEVGGRTILEYWIPAEDLPELNANITGVIELVAESANAGVPGSQGSCVLTTRPVRGRRVNRFLGSGASLFRSRQRD